MSLKAAVGTAEHTCTLVLELPPMTLHSAHATFEDNLVPESLRQKEFIQPFKGLVQETFSHSPLLLQMHMPCECFTVT